MEPAELSRWVARMRRADAALGTARIVPSAADRADALKYYRSVCTLRPVRAGEELTIDNVAGKRPGTGMPTMLLDQVWGRRAVRDLVANTLLREGDFA
jgi:sialic acid synthase SpsE